jgi:hypothetical protein
MPTALKRGVRTTEFWAVAVLILITGALAWRGIDPKHTIGAGIATAMYAAARTVLKLFALWLERKCIVNLKGFLTGILTGYIDKTLAANLSADEQVVVNNAIAAAVDLTLLIVEKEGVKLFAVKNPQVAAAITAALNPPKAA